MSQVMHGLYEAGLRGRDLTCASIGVKKHSRKHFSEHNRRLRTGTSRDGNSRYVVASKIGLQAKQSKLGQKILFIEKKNHNFEIILLLADFRLLSFCT